ncbi:MAG: hypothetical protein KAR42_14125 [candidate division Zixibacteria bacterium]|nr:hypothetical protein [candidate division Zixibacteria bacterium]
MGAQMAQVYEDAKSTGGLKAVMRLAMKTKISSKQAADDPDTPDSVQKLKTALAEVKKSL